MTRASEPSDSGEPTSRARRRRRAIDRFEVAGIFALGAVCGMLLWQCAPLQKGAEDPRVTTLRCQALVIAPWLGPRLTAPEHMPFSSAALVRDLRRCAGFDTPEYLPPETPLPPPLPSPSREDLFGIGGFVEPWSTLHAPDSHPIASEGSGDPDAGPIFRSY
jgi:hypothetical protein